MADVEVTALDGGALGQLARLLVFGLQRLGEAGGDVGQRDASLGALRAGHRRNDGRQVEIERVGEHGVRHAVGAEHALRLGVCLDQRDAALFAAGHGEIGQRLMVDREEAAGGAVLGRHVGDGGAVGERHGVEAGAEELDELADDALLAQHLRDREHEVGRRDAFGQLARELEADDFRQQHRLRLAEHGGLRLDAADAPAEHGEAVDHGGVAVGADERVGVGEDGAVRVRARPHRLRKELEVHLVADAGAGRHDAEVVEGALAPLEEVVALGVALVLELDVVAVSLRGAEVVDDHRVVDDEIDGHQRIDLLRIAAEAFHAVAHCREVDDGGNAGEVLHQHAGGAEADFGACLAAVIQPAGDVLDVGLGDRAAVLVAQQVFQQHHHREGQLGYAGQSVLLGFGQRVVGVRLATGRERLAALEAVQRHRRCVLQNRLLRAAATAGHPRSSTLPHGRLATALV